MSKSSKFEIVAVLSVLAACAARPAEAQLRAFVTSGFHASNLGGLAGADAVCQAAADNANPSMAGRTFVAWLSDSVNDAYCRVQGLAGKRGDNCEVAGDLPGAGPWARVGDGIVWSTDVDELTTTGPRLPLDRDESGNPVTGPGRFTTTGTRPDGTVYIDAGIDIGTCADWTSDAPSIYKASGDLTGVGFDWAYAFSGSCQGPQRLYCLEVGTGPAIPRPKFADSGLAFLTAQGAQGVFGGLSQGDDLCRAEAAAAGLPFAQEFVALLSTSGVDAADRLFASTPYTRVDDYRIADDRADLLDGSLQAALVVRADGSSPSADSIPYVWTGTTSTGTNFLDTNCSDWVGSASLGRMGRASMTADGSWLSFSTLPCNTPLQLYCFLNRTILFWDNYETGTAALARWSGVAP